MFADLSRDVEILNFQCQHTCISFTDITGVLQKLREHLYCRCCKQQLVLYLGQAFLNVVPPVLHGDQRVVTSGCYDSGKAMTISGSGVEECPSLLCDAEESDTRVWLHVLCSCGRKKLLYSPDTDVYHISLTLIDTSVHDVYVQVSNISSRAEVTPSLSTQCWIRAPTCM